MTVRDVIVCVLVAVAVFVLHRGQPEGMIATACLVTAVLTSSRRRGE